MTNRSFSAALKQQTPADLLQRVARYLKSEWAKHLWEEFLGRIYSGHSRD
jgi:hypothetical protein